MKNKIIFLISLVFLVAFIFNPFGSNMFELPKVQFTAIYTAIFLIGLIVYFFYKGGINIRYNKYVGIFFFLWLLSLILSTIFSIAPELSFWGSYDRMQGLNIQIIYLIFFIFFLNFLVTKKAQETFLKILLAVASVTAIHGILQQFGIDFFSESLIRANEFFGRSFATFGQPNEFGQFLLFPIWGAVYFITRKNKKIWLPILIAILLAITLFFTQNRASILGLLAGIMIFLLIQPKIKFLYKYAISIGGIAAFISFVIFIAPTTRSLATRFLLWEGSFKLVPDHPILGSGLETFGSVFQKVADPQLIELESIFKFADRAHNQFLDILVTRGILGLTIFSVILLSLLYLIFKNKKEILKNKMLQIGVVAFISIFISNMFGFSLTTNTLILMSVLALILNSMLKFKTAQIRPTIINVTAVMVLGIFSITQIVSSSKIVYSDVLYQQGKTAIYSQNIEEGVTKIEKAIVLNPNQSELYYYLAETATMLGGGLKNPEILLKAYDLLEEGGSFTNKDFLYYLIREKLKGAVNNTAPLN